MSEMSVRRELSRGGGVCAVWAAFARRAPVGSVGRWDVGGELSLLDR